MPQAMVAELGRTLQDLILNPGFLLESLHSFLNTEGCVPVLETNGIGLEPLGTGGLQRSPGGDNPARFANHCSRASPLRFNPDFSTLVMLPAGSRWTHQPALWLSSCFYASV